MTTPRGHIVSLECKEEMGKKQYDIPSVSIIDRPAQIEIFFIILAIRENPPEQS